MRHRHVRRRALIAVAALSATALAGGAPGNASPAVVGGSYGGGIQMTDAAIGQGQATCVPGPGADCRGIVQRWTLEYHGSLRRARFAKAELRGADLRGADLRGADFRGAMLRHADLRGARLRGARFGPAPGPRARATQVPGAAPACAPSCAGADLSFANLSSALMPGADFTGANLSFADLSSSLLTGANLTSADMQNADVFDAYLANANLSGAYLAFAYMPLVYMSGANLTNANLLNADLSTAYLGGATTSGWNTTGVIWGNTTCPNGTIAGSLTGPSTC